jgi:hypothetical protein
MEEEGAFRTSDDFEAALKDLRIKLSDAAKFLPFFFSDSVCSRLGELEPDGSDEVPLHKLLVYLVPLNELDLSLFTFLKACFDLRILVEVFSSQDSMNRHAEHFVKCGKVEWFPRPPSVPQDLLDDLKKGLGVDCHNVPLKQTQNGWILKGMYARREVAIKYGKGEGNWPNNVKSEFVVQVYKQTADFVVMELGSSNLQEWVNANQSTKSDLALYFLFGVACGMRDIHNGEVFHRDLCMENVVICKDKPKIADLTSAIELKNLGEEIKKRKISGRWSIGARVGNFDGLAKASKIGNQEEVVEILKQNDIDCFSLIYEEMRKVYQLPILEKCSSFHLIAEFIAKNRFMWRKWRDKQVEMFKEMHPDINGQDILELMVWDQRELPLTLDLVLRKRGVIELVGRPGMGRSTALFSLMETMTDLFPIFLDCKNIEDSIERNLDCLKFCTNQRSVAALLQFMEANIGQVVLLLDNFRGPIKLFENFENCLQIRVPVAAGSLDVCTLHICGLKLEDVKRKLEEKLNLEPHMFLCLLAQNPSVLRRLSKIEGGPFVEETLYCNFLLEMKEVKDRLLLDELPTLEDFQFVCSIESQKLEKLSFWSDHASRISEDDDQFLNSVLKRGAKEASSFRCVGAHCFLFLLLIVFIGVGTGFSGAHCGVSSFSYANITITSSFLQHFDEGYFPIWEFIVGGLNATFFTTVTSTALPGLGFRTEYQANKELQKFPIWSCAEIRNVTLKLAQARSGYSLSFLVDQNPYDPLLPVNYFESKLAEFKTMCVVGLSFCALSALLIVVMILLSLFCGYRARRRLQKLGFNVYGLTPKRDDNAGLNEEIIPLIRSV